MISQIAATALWNVTKTLWAQLSAHFVTSVQWSPSEILWFYNKVQSTKYISETALQAEEAGLAFCENKTSKHWIVFRSPGDGLFFEWIQVDLWAQQSDQDSHCVSSQSFHFSVCKVSCVVLVLVKDYYKGMWEQVIGSTVTVALLKIAPSAPDF